MAKYDLKSYLYIRKDRTAFSSEHLFWYGWRDMHMIIDLNTCMYLVRETWRDKDDEPEWIAPPAEEI